GFWAPFGVYSRFVSRTCVGRGREPGALNPPSCCSCMVISRLSSGAATKKEMQPQGCISFFIYTVLCPQSNHTVLGVTRKGIRLDEKRTAPKNAATDC